MRHTDGQCSCAGENVVAQLPARQRVIEELRQIGQIALQNWAERKQTLVEQAAEAGPQLVRKEKSLVWQTRLVLQLQIAVSPYK